MKKTKTRTRPVGYNRANDGRERYYIAINGASCALCSVAMTTCPSTSPLAMQFIGFTTIEEARAAQELCLNAPIPEVKKAMQAWGTNPDVLVYTPLDEPDEPNGQTIWLTTR